MMDAEALVVVVDVDFLSEPFRDQSRLALPKLRRSDNPHYQARSCVSSLRAV